MGLVLTGLVDIVVIDDLGSIFIYIGLASYT